MPQTVEDGVNQMLAACGAGDVEKIDALIAVGVDVREANQSGITPLFCAMLQNQHRAIGRLMEAGASPLDMLKSHPWWPHDFIASKSILGPESIEAISKAAGWSWDASQNEDGRTVLGVIAAEQHSVQVQQARALIAGGASATAEDSAGLTPMAMAAFNGSPGMVQLLAQHCDVNAKLRTTEDPGATVLHIAATGTSIGRLARVSILLEAGADPSIKDDKGLTARQWAENAGASEVVGLLDSHVALHALRRAASMKPRP